MVSEELQRPEKSIPIALIAGVGLVAVLYTGSNAGIQRALPATAIAGASVPAAAASEAALGRLGITLVSVGMMISMLATLNGTVMSGGRVPFAVARDGYLFKALGEVHPKSTRQLWRSSFRERRCCFDCSGKGVEGMISRHLRRVAVLHDRGEYNFRLPHA